MATPKRSEASKAKARSVEPEAGPRIFHNIMLYQLDDGRWISETPGNYPKQAGLIFQGTTPLDAVSKTIETLFLTTPKA